MILAVLLLLSGLTISAVAIYYSVMGLMAIFSAAAVPIAIMGVSLEVGKLVTASWIKAHWTRLPLLMKTYAVTAVAILMVITSLGIFGYLSKAHSDQTLVSGDVQAKIAIYDERIKTEKDNIEADRKQIAQMDAAVDQVLSRTEDEKGATKANEIRRSQLKDRSRLQNEILESQKKIAVIQDERAPFAAENRKVEAEVGPIKYIAAFVYGANPDANILERAVTWVIILIVIVFDPLAVVMLLASQMTFAWIREERAQQEEEYRSGEITKDTQSEIVTDLAVEPPDPYVADVGVKPAAEELLPEPDAGFTEDYPKPEPKVVITPEEWEALDAISAPEPEYEYEFVEEHSGEEEHNVRTWAPEEVTNLNTQIENVVLDASVERPGDYITPPDPPRVIEASPHPGKKDRGAPIVADNAPQVAGNTINSDFGNTFPPKPQKGDVYLRTDYLPNRLFKFNGFKWIEVDKEQTDTYAYNDQYIWHLIDQLEQGKYDPEILTDIEREQIAEQLERGKNVQ